MWSDIMPTRKGLPLELIRSGRVCYLCFLTFTRGPVNPYHLRKLNPVPVICASYLYTPFGSNSLQHTPLWSCPDEWSGESLGALQTLMLESHGQPQPPALLPPPTSNFLPSFFIVCQPQRKEHWSLGVLSNRPWVFWVYTKCFLRDQQVRCSMHLRRP